MTRKLVGQLLLGSLVAAIGAITVFAQLPIPVPGPNDGQRGQRGGPRGGAQAAPATPLLVYTMHEDAAMLKQALARGAVGIVPKTHSAKLLQKAILPQAASPAETPIMFCSATPTGKKRSGNSCPNLTAEVE